MREFLAIVKTSLIVGNVVEMGESWYKPHKKNTFRNWRLFKMQSFFLQKIGSPTSASAAELVESLVSQSLASPTTKPESSSSPLSYEASSSPAPVADPVLEHVKVRRMSDSPWWRHFVGEVFGGINTDTTFHTSIYLFCSLSFTASLLSVFFNLSQHQS